MIILDIDLFKNFNEKYGYECGDEMLRLLGKFINDSIQKSHIACRDSGGQFIIVLPESSLKETTEVAEFLRNSVKTISVNRGGKALSITLSLGVSSYPEDGLTREEIIAAAEKALYKAKQTGRDKVIVSS